MTEPAPRPTARTVALILAAALALVAAYTALRTGDVTTATADLTHAVDLVEQAAAPEAAPVEAVPVDTDGAP